MEIYYGVLTLLLMQREPWRIRALTLHHNWCNKNRDVRYIYKPKSLRTLEEIRADIEALERETEGLLDQILVEVGDD